MTKKRKPKKKPLSKRRKIQLKQQAMLIAHGFLDKHGKPILRDPVLSEKALAYAAKIVKSRKLSIKFLKKAGIIERPGKLHRNYR
jgi:hypothetical protein